MEHLETKRLSLEPWDERHRRAWRRICRDREVMRFVGAGEVWEADKADVWEADKADDAFARALEHWREHGFGWRSLLDRETGRWLGFAGLNYVGRGTEGVTRDEVEIGWWVVREAWGCGYASEGAAAARDEGFERIGLDRLIARIQPANAASIRVAHQIGMSLERQTRGRVAEDLHIYSLCRNAWSRRADEASSPPLNA